MSARDVIIIVLASMVLLAAMAIGVWQGIMRWETRIYAEGLEQQQDIELQRMTAESNNQA